MSRKRIKTKEYEYDFASKSDAELANMARKAAQDIRALYGGPQSQHALFLEEIAKRLETADA